MGSPKKTKAASKRSASAHVIRHPTIQKESNVSVDLKTSPPLKLFCVGVSWGRVWGGEVLNVTHSGHS